MGEEGVTNLAAMLRGAGGALMGCGESGGDGGGKPCGHGLLAGEGRPHGGVIGEKG